MAIDISAITGSSGLSQLAEAYRQQILGSAQELDNAGTSGAVSAASRAQATRSADFDSMLTQGLSSLEALDTAAASKAVQAATGDLSDVHDYVIAATQAQVATELTTTIRNKALEAFNDIMRMPL